jgi:arylformamidase
MAMTAQTIPLSTLSRRSFALGAAALGATLPWSARAQTAKVFLDYTQEELDRAYDQSNWAKNAREVIKRYGTASAAVRAKLKFETKAYGMTPEETLDIYPASLQNADGSPIHIFAHGGAWRGGTKEMYAFPAPAFVEAGAIYIALDFANIPKVRLPDMAQQVRTAIAWVYKNAKSFGGNPERITLSGHSSGGHLAAVALTTDWSRYEVPQKVLKAGLVVSGMFDLHPVMLSARSSYVKISKEEQAALSPQRHLDRIACPIAVAHGDGESPEFKRQARDFVAATKGKVSQPVELVECKGFNHFEIIETIAKPDGILGRIALKQLGLAKS